jgi:hypothetical protein
MNTDLSPRTSEDRLLELARTDQRRRIPNPGCWNLALAEAEARRSPECTDFTARILQFYGVYSCRQPYQRFNWLPLKTTAAVKRMRSCVQSQGPYLFPTSLAGSLSNAAVGSLARATFTTLLLLLLCLPPRPHPPQTLERTPPSTAELIQVSRN